MNSTNDQLSTEPAIVGNNVLAAGFTTKSGFTLKKQVKTLDEFWEIINNDKSIFARHRMYPTAFFHSWQIRLIKQWIDNGWFFQACR